MAVKEDYLRVFTGCFGAGWMRKWKVVFPGRVESWADGPQLDDAMQLEVECATESEEGWPEGSFEHLYALVHAEATE